MTRPISDRTLFGVDWRGAISAGLAGGLVFVIILMILAPLLGLSTWMPVYMIGAIVLGYQALGPTATFSVNLFLTGLAVHLFFSLLYAFVLAAWIREKPTRQAVGIGFLFGLALYLLNFYIFATAYPWFIELRGLETVIAHFAYGGLTAWVYNRIEEPAWEERLGEPV